MAYNLTDRRPIAARRLRVMNVLAHRLASAGASANAISIFGVLCATVAAAALAWTGHAEPSLARWLWLLAAFGVQGRLLCNLLDGMVAIERGTASPLGEIFNEVPDRYSDVVILVCLGYAAGGLAALGWAAALAAVLTAYIRAVGKSLGQPSDFRGIMAKQQRMFLVTLLGLAGLVAPEAVAQHRVTAWTAGIIALGALVTCAGRLGRIVSKLGGATEPIHDAAPQTQDAGGASQEDGA